MPDASPFSKVFFLKSCFLGVYSLSLERLALKVFKPSLPFSKESVRQDGFPRTQGGVPGVVLKNHKHFPQRFLPLELAVSLT